MPINRHISINHVQVTSEQMTAEQSRLDLIFQNLRTDIFADILTNYFG